MILDNNLPGSPINLQNIARGVFYALALVIGMIIAFQALDEGDISRFRTITLVLTAIFAVEVYTGWSLRKHAHRQTKLHLGDTGTRTAELLNHVAIPTSVYLWTLIFGYFNSQATLRLVIIITAFFLLSLLFTNTRNYYLNQKSAWEETNFIYDLAKFYLFFVGANSLINLFNAQPLLTSIGVGLISFGLLFLAVMRYRKLEFFGLKLVAITSVIIALVTGILIVLKVGNILALSTFTTLGYYLGAAFIHHLMEDNLSWELAAEYVAVAALAIALLLGFS